MNVNQLLAAITSSADEHDMNTGEANDDLILVLREALDYIHASEGLDRFVEKLALTEMAEIPEFEDWLKPDTSYVRNSNTSDRALLFHACRLGGFQQAANAVQNEGEISLDDMEEALNTITDPELNTQFDNYITAHLVSGKDAE